MHKPLNEYAAIIRQDWAKPSPYAAPYIDAMRYGNQVTDKYLIGDFKSVVLGFLANAQSWRGDAAKQVKAELKQIAR